MRELHVVAVSEDGRHVLLGATRSTKTGTFRVKLDERLVAAVRGDLRLAEAPAPELSPKEIQARLRAGESAEAIARKAGVAITRVERFAGPVAGEMARMIEAARDARLVRRSGPSLAPLGKAVDDHVGEAEATWTTRREDDGRWRVSVAWTARNRRRSGSWWWDPHTSELTAVDAASASLGHVGEPVKRAPKPAPEPAVAARKAPAARKKTPAKKVPAQKTPAKKAPAGKKAAAKPVAARSVAKKPAQKPAGAGRKAAAAPSRRTGVKQARPRLQVVPDPPARRKGRTAEERDGVAARASVPAWADVLLGTTPADR